MTNTIKDSGNRTVFATGSVRDIQEGKGRMDLLPHLAIIEVSKHCEAGAKKYGEHNVDKGIPLHSLCDSAARHLFKFMHGETDENHLVAAAWNLLWAIQTRETHPELADIPVASFSKEKKTMDDKCEGKHDNKDGEDKTGEDEIGEWISRILKNLNHSFKPENNFTVPKVGVCCRCGKDCDIPLHPEWKDKECYRDDDEAQEWDCLNAEDCIYEVEVATRMVTFGDDDIRETSKYYLCGECTNKLLDFWENIPKRDIPKNTNTR